MNMMVKSPEVECSGPKSRSGTRQPPTTAFMDDITVMTTCVHGCRWLFQGLEQLISLAKMCFKSAKSRSLVLKKGKVANHFCFTLGGTRIPTVTKKPVKRLGKIFNSSRPRLTCHCGSQPSTNLVSEESSRPRCTRMESGQEPSGPC